MTTTQDAPAGTASAVGWRLNVLGPLELRHGERRVEVAGTVRILLALLARSPGQVVTTASLISGIWGGEPPVDADKTVASFATRLSKAIAGAAGTDGADIVVTEPTGYVLSIAPSDVDLNEFERLVAEGTRALAVAQPMLAVSRLDSALALWRGEAYADLGSHAFARAESSRLGDLRLSTMESRVDAQLAAAAPGAPASLVSELQDLVAEHPHRERLWIQLITTLYRLGRQGDALTAHRQARARLVEDLGVEPGADLRAAERAVLADDPALLGTPVVPTAVPDPLDATTSACFGRDQEIAWLEAALDIAATRRAQARLIIGGRGLGKTRLVAEVAGRAATRGVVVRYGQNGALDAVAAEPDRLTLVIVDDVDQAALEDLPRVVSFIRSTSDRPVLTLLTAKDPVRVGELAGLPKLVLTALGEQAIADLVRLYAPGTTDATAIAAMVNAIGVPARIHWTASEWAFARAGRRIDRAVADAAEPGRWLTSVREEIVAGVLDLEHVRTRARALRPPVREVATCPYKGLAPFEASDAALFHGREAVVAELVARLVETKLLAVVGVSGSGKSSVVRAGLLPAITAGVLPGSSQWRQVVLMPATAGDPRTHVSGDVDGRTLLVVDQFEEVFTTLDADREQSFVAALVDIVNAGRATAVITLRSDFYPRCADHTALSSLVTANTVLVRPMAVDELRRAIERPAATASLSIEDGLVDVLVDATLDAPDGLPRLSAALLSLWEHRSGRSLTQAAYRAGAGVAGSIEAVGEQAYAALSSNEEREAARQILVRLASADGEYPVARRLATRSDLATIAGASSALEVLSNWRLVTVTDDVVDVTHEVLFAHWPRARRWLDEDAASRQFRKQLTEAASVWAASGGPASGGATSGSELYRGARLAIALDRASVHPSELTGVERAFLAASQDAAEADELRRRRGARRLRQLLTAAVLAFVVAVAGVAVTVTQTRRADAASRRADAGRLAAEAIAQPDLRLAALLAVAATTLDDSTQIRASVRSVLMRSPDVVAAAGVTGGDRITAVAVSPDGRTLAASSLAGPIWLYHADDLSAPVRLNYPGHGPVNGVAFTPDGRRIVSWGGSRTWTDGQPTTSIVVWDAASGAPMGSAFGEAWPDVGGGLLADGVTLVLKQQHPANGTPPTAVTWNIDARTPSTAYEIPSTSVDSLSLGLDERAVVIGTGSGALVASVATGVARQVRATGKPGALSPNGATLLVADGEDVALWDVASSRSLGVARRHSGEVLGTAWAPDGRVFASVGADGLAVVWDAATRRPRAVFAGHAGPVRVVRFASDGRTLYTAGDDGALIAWDLTGSRGLGADLHTADEAAWVRLACDLAGRDMTREEWTRHVPSRPYRQVCPV